MHAHEAAHTERACGRLGAISTTVLRQVHINTISVQLMPDIHNAVPEFIIRAFPCKDLEEVS
jgi:hypothetical protein